MGANVIVSAGTVPDAPGRGQGSHLFYAVNTGYWWCFYYTSTSATTLYAKYSADLVTWNTPTNNTVTLTRTNNSLGVQLGVTYANISSTDVVHIGYISSGGTSYQQHIRATLSGTTITWGTDTQTNSQASAIGTGLSVATAVASNGYVFDSYSVDASDGGDFNAVRSSNADTGSSWTTGFATHKLLFSSTNTVESFFLAPLSSGGQVITLGDNGSTTGTPNQVEYSVYTGSAWSPSTATAVFATTTGINANDWGACSRTDTDVHAVRRNDSTSTFTHRRWNGTSWSAGSTIANNTCKGSAGLAMCSDGTSVWLFIIDSNAANTVRYNTWTSAGGWAGWTALESTTQTRNYITAVYSATTSTIAVAWAQTNGSNYDYAVEAYTPGGGGPADPYPAAYSTIFPQPVYRM